MNCATELKQRPDSSKFGRPTNRPWMAYYHETTSNTYGGGAHKNNAATNHGHDFFRVVTAVLNGETEFLEK